MASTSVSDELKEILKEAITSGTAFKAEDLERMKQEKQEEAKKPEPEDFVDLQDPNLEETETHKKFSTLFGWTPDAGDFLVRVFSTDELSEEQAQDVPEEDPFYIPPKEEIELFVRSMEMNYKPRLVGDQSVGKSSLPRFVSAKTGRPFARINFNPDMESADVLGSYVVKEGSMQWMDGEYPKAMMGPYMLLLDELYRAPSTISMALQRAFERGGDLKINQKYEGNNLYTPHDQFRICVADNTKGLGDRMEEFTSAFVQDASSLDRFEVTIELGFPKQDDEKRLLKSWAPQISDALADKLVKFASLCRDGYKQQAISVQFSNRKLRTIAEQSVVLRNPVKAIKYAFWASLADDAEKDTLDSYLDTVNINTGKYGRLRD